MKEKLKSKKMKEKMKFGIISQGYAAPHAESVAIAHEQILCSSRVLDGQTENFNRKGYDW